MVDLRRPATPTSASERGAYQEDVRHALEPPAKRGPAIRTKARLDAVTVADSPVPARLAVDPNGGRRARSFG
jgi:hypothetical protein